MSVATAAAAREMLGRFTNPPMSEESRRSGTPRPGSCSGDPEPGAHRLDQHRDQVRGDDHPHQEVAIVRASREVRGEVARIHVGNRGDERWSQKRPDRAQAAAISGERRVRRPRDRRLAGQNRVQAQAPGGRLGRRRAAERGRIFHRRRRPIASIDTASGFAEHWSAANATVPVWVTGDRGLVGLIPDGVHRLRVALARPSVCTASARVAPPRA